MLVMPSGSGALGPHHAALGHGLPEKNRQHVAFSLPHPLPRLLQDGNLGMVSPRRVPYAEQLRYAPQDSNVLQ